MYARILICCQKFGEAVTYLWSKNKRFSAVHLLIGCLHHGFLLPTLNLVESGFFGEINTTPAVILAKYFDESFRQNFASVVVAYLMSLRCKWLDATKAQAMALQIRQDFQKIMIDFLVSLQTHQVVELVGGSVLTIQANSVLGQYLSQLEINSLLSQSAREIQKSHRNPRRAIEFYFHCGDFTSALEVLCSEIKKVLFDELFKSNLSKS